MAPWVTGLLLAGKQYLIFSAPAVLRKWRDVPKAAVAAVAITAPLALWNLWAFLDSAVILHFVQPVRPEALSYMALAHRYGYQVPGWIPFLITAMAIAFVVRRAPSTTTAIFSAASLLLLVFFMFNKSAFCNYYYLVVAALASAVATADVSAPAEATRGAAATAPAVR